MNRRDALKAMTAVTAGLVSGSISRSARGQVVSMGMNKMPVGYVAHGSPLLLADKVRGPELTRWGSSIPKPKGIVVMTPHYRAEGIEIGHVGRGFGMYNLPQWILERTPKATYETPSNEALAARVDDVLAAAHRTARVASDRPGFDHTTWIPLFHMFPSADVPVVELAMPFTNEEAIFLLGRVLAPLRDEGVFILGSGTVTHNLAATDMENRSPLPSWAAGFDAWTKKTLAAGDTPALLDWRARAPQAEVAHPDDGGHFRALLFALGAASENGKIASTKFPVEGFELGNLSKRCVEIA